MLNIDETETLVQTEVARELLERHDVVLGSFGSIKGIKIGLEVYEQFTASHWRGSRKNGKLSVKVGDWISTKSVNFRQLKAGGFNYDKIADKMIEIYKDHIAEVNRIKDRDNRIVNYDAMIKHAVDVHGTYEYGGVVQKRTSEDYKQCYGVAVKLKVETTEQIDALLNLAKELGIKMQ